MPVFFIDSSALVKRYRNEPGSRLVSNLIESADRLIIARLTVVEVIAALVRRARGNHSAVHELDRAIASLYREIQASFEVVELDEPLMEQAAVLARRHALRGADAIQLACLLLARNDSQTELLTFLCADEELNAAAVAEGLTVENPNLHP